MSLYAFRTYDYSRYILGILTLLCGTISGISLYHDSELIRELNESSWSQLTASDHLWIVNFYQPSCPRCEDLAPEFAKAAEQLRDYARFAVVNGEADKALATSHAITVYPSILAFSDRQILNPYTGKYYRKHKVYDISPVITSKNIVKFALKNMPSYVEPLGDENFDSFIGSNKGSKIVLLLSEKDKVAPLFKALSAEFASRGLIFAQLHKSAEVFATRFSTIEKCPALLVIENLTTKNYTQYSGTNIKNYHELVKFLEPFALSTVAPMEPAGGESFLEVLDAKKFDELIVKREKSWIVLFKSNGEDEKQGTNAELKAFDNDIRKIGMVSMGIVNCNTERVLCAQYGEPGIRVFPYIDRKGEIASAVQIAKSLSDAKEIATAALPDKCERIHSPQGIQNILIQAKARGLLPVLMLTKKPQVSALVKALSVALEGKVLITLYPNPPENVIQQFGGHSLPLIAVMYEQPTKSETKKGEVEWGIMPYSRKQYGPFTFNTIAGFIIGVYNQVKPNGLTWTEAGTSAKGEGATTMIETLDIPRLSSDNWGKMCLDQSLCAIAFLRQVDDNGEGTNLEVIRRIAAKSKSVQDPFTFSWLNGQCYSEFAETFNVQSMNLPTLVVFSPKKLRYATHVGTLDEESGRDFLRALLSGRIGTVPISKVPKLVAKDCTGINAAPELIVDEDEDMGDMMQEILAEEAKKKVELQKEVEEEAKRLKLAEEKRRSEEQQAKATAKKEKKKLKKKKRKKKANDKDEL